MTTNEEHLRALRERLTDQELAQSTAAADQRRGMVAVAVAVAVLALTASPWFYEELTRPAAEISFSLWGVFGQTGWPMLTIVLIAVVGIGTISSAVAGDSGRVFHWVYAGLAALIPVLVWVTGMSVDDDLKSTAAPWLVVVGAVTLFGLHMTRGSTRRQVVRA